jgi:hypothetical protein
MAYDFAVDLKTGDWLFSAGRDLQGVAGEGVVQQRAAIRLKIPVGEFIYDDTGVLGSRLHLVKRHDVNRALDEIPPLIEEALAPMPDLSVLDVQVEMDQPDPNVRGDKADPHLVKAAIQYSTVLSDVADDQISDENVDTDDPIVAFQMLELQL